MAGQCHGLNLIWSGQRPTNETGWNNCSTLDVAVVRPKSIGFSFLASIFIEDVHACKLGGFAQLVNQPLHPFACLQILTCTCRFLPVNSHWFPTWLIGSDGKLGKKGHGVGIISENERVQIIARPLNMANALACNHKTGNTDPSGVLEATCIKKSYKWSSNNYYSKNVIAS